MSLSDATVPLDTPWRAPDDLGLLPGLRAFQRELRASGATQWSVAGNTVSLGRKFVTMTARGAMLRPRFRRAASTPLVGRGVRISGLSQIDVGRRVRIEDRAEIQGTSRVGIALGDHVTIDTDVIIRPSGYYGRTLGVGLNVGARTSIGPHCFIGCLGGVTIGADVMLAPGVMVFAESHLFDSLDRTIKSQGLEARPVVIGDNCWIASGVIITGGVHVGDGAVIGAGSVVTRDVEPGAIVGGVPARILRHRAAVDQHLSSE